IVRQAREMKDQTMWKEHEWIEARKLLDEARPELLEKEKKKQESQEQLTELSPGDDVRLTTVNQNGTILEKVGDKEYLIQVGMIRLKAKRKDLKPIKLKNDEAKEQVVTTIRTTNGHVKTELDLRGERYENAIHKVEKYIDDAIVAGYSSVSIIHG